MKAEVSGILWSSRLYHVAGAAAGVAQGLEIETKSQLEAVVTTAGNAAGYYVIKAQEATEEWGERLLITAYVAAGACAGILSGSKYALTTFKVWLLEDEVSLHLINPAPSPIKYRFGSADFRIHTSRPESRSLTGGGGAGGGSRCSSRSSSKSPRAVYI